MQTEDKKEKARQASKRYREKHKEKLRARRKEAFRRSYSDPEKYAKVKEHKKAYRNKHKARLAEKQKIWTRNNPDKVKDINLRMSYGIGLDEYRTKLAEQDGVCAICGCSEVLSNRSLSVDHNHLTGAVRGLLCSLCNKGIGSLKEDVQILQKAIAYLLRWE